MSIDARLELGEVEKTGYTDPITGERVEIEFEHPTDGQWGQAQKDAGLIYDNEGNTVGLESGVDATIVLEKADILLAARCITKPADPEKLHRKALLKIGRYLREQATLRLTEGELLGPPPSGPTSENSETSATTAPSAA